MSRQLTQKITTQTTRKISHLAYKKRASLASYPLAFYVIFTLAIRLRMAL